MCTHSLRPKKKVAEATLQGTSQGRGFHCPNDLKHEGNKILKFGQYGLILDSLIFNCKPLV